MSQSLKIARKVLFVESTVQMKNVRRKLSGGKLDEESPNPGLCVHQTADSIEKKPLFVGMASGIGANFAKQSDDASQVVLIEETGVGVVRAGAHAFLE